MRCPVRARPVRNDFGRATFESGADILATVDPELYLQCGYEVRILRLRHSVGQHDAERLGISSKARSTNWTATFGQR